VLRLRARTGLGYKLLVISSLCVYLHYVGQDQITSLNTNCSGPTLLYELIAVLEHGCLADSVFRSDSRVLGVDGSFLRCAFAWIVWWRLGPFFVTDSLVTGSARSGDTVDERPDGLVVSRVIPSSIRSKLDTSRSRFFAPAAVNLQIRTRRFVEETPHSAFTNSSLSRR
jgi:hypothetical protein